MYSPDGLPDCSSVPWHHLIAQSFHCRRSPRGRLKQLSPVTGDCTLCKCLSSAQTAQNSSVQRALTANGTCTPQHCVCSPTSCACTQRRLAGCGREHLQRWRKQLCCVRWVVGNQGNLSLKEWAFAALFHSSSSAEE